MSQELENGNLPEKIQIKSSTGTVTIRTDTAITIRQMMNQIKALQEAEGASAINVDSNSVFIHISSKDDPDFKKVVILYNGDLDKALKIR